MNKKLENDLKPPYYKNLTRYITGDDMHFNLYLDNETAERLKSATEKSHESRNAIIRKAINQWLDKTHTQTWPDTVLNYQGDPNIPAFEATRDELKQPNEDPFA